MSHQICINGTPVTYKRAYGIKGFIVQMERQKSTQSIVKTVCKTVYYMCGSHTN